jgi:hypothetical protein
VAPVRLRLGSDASADQQHDSEARGAKGCLHVHILLDAVG